MEVKLCKRCKRMFQHITGPEVCQQCKKKEEEMFQRVKEYLRKNPGDSMQTVSQETETPVSVIENFLRQGRLEVTQNSPITLLCETCGDKIYSGRLCNKCNADLVNGLSGLARDLRSANEPKKKPEAAEKMRFLKSDRIK